MVSTYWAKGGDVGLDELGGKLDELGRARDPMLGGLGPEEQCGGWFEASVRDAHTGLSNRVAHVDTR